MTESSLDVAAAAEPVDEVPGDLVLAAPMPAPAAATRLAETIAGPRNVLVPVIIGIALFMQTLDSTIIGNALPTMARSLHESPLALNLAITSYLLAAAIFLPISGWLADRFGARLVFIIAIIGFAVSSLFCGLASTLPMMIVARFVQGCAGAMMVPVGRLVLLKTVPKHDLVDAMSWLTVPAILGPVLGPPLGGFIVTFGSWRWIFFLNLPIAVLGVVCVSLFVPDVREEGREPLDLRGFILSGLGLAGLIFGFENLGRSMLPFPLVIGLVMVGAIALVLFSFHARRTAHPILDLSLFKYQTFLTATLGGTFPRLIIGASGFLMALLLQIGFGLSAFQAGLVTFAGAFGALLMKTTAPPIIRRFGFKPVLLTVAICQALIFSSYSLFAKDTPHLLITAILFVGGFFASLHFTALNSLAYADLEQHDMSKASTLASMMQQLALSLGVGISALVVGGLQAASHTAALTASDISPAFVFIGAGALISLAFYLTLPANAGELVSGKTRRFEGGE
ncbi:MAG: DHA2 family efflux MFS transporter permease subunit [Alphaproteobacteria bacterium]